MTSSAPVTQETLPAVNAVLPLSLLEAVQGVDAPVPDGLDEYHHDLTAKRFGMSQTVAAQVERFARLARAGARVPGDELVALLRLVGRRPDAGLVFTDAGRRAGRYAVRGMAAPLRGAHAALPGPVRNAMGFRLVRQRAGAVLGMAVERRDGVPHGTLRHPHATVATSSGTACAFYGAALAEMLRALTDFDGAVLHVACRARDEDACLWRASGAS